MSKNILSGLIILYFIITTTAFCYAMAGQSPSPRFQPIIFYSYGMMAPYQGYETFHQGLSAEGLKDNGTWESIDLDPYFPFLHGEKTMRSYVNSYLLKDDFDLHHKSFKRMARHIQRLEKKDGRSFEHIRLYWDTWPMSPDGIYTRLKDERITHTLMAEI